MRFVLAVAAIMTRLFLPGTAFAADNPVEGGRLVVRSSSHEECVAKLTKAAAFSIMLSKDRPASEEARVTIVAQPGSIGNTTEYRTVDRKWHRIVGMCDDEVYVQNEYVSEAPTSSTPPLADMHEVRTHVMQSFSTQDACIADLLSVAGMALGVTGMQGRDEAKKGEEMRLMLLHGAVRTEAWRTDADGNWLITSTTCEKRRETVVTMATTPVTNARRKEP